MEGKKLTESKLNMVNNPPEPIGGILSQVVKDKKKKKKKLTAKERAKVNTLDYLILLQSLSLLQNTIDFNNKYLIRKNLKAQVIKFLKIPSL